jgi:hypothetical protein
MLNGEQEHDVRPPSQCHGIDEVTTEGKREKGTAEWSLYTR